MIQPFKAPIWSLEICHDAKRIASQTCAADDPTATPEYARLAELVAAANAHNTGTERPAK